MFGVVPPGTTIDDRYIVMDTLGGGGMGNVYRAEEIALKRIVALKILHSSELDDADSRARFVREGKIISDLAHKNLAIFYRLGLWQQQYPYIALEYLQGKSLKELVADNQPLEWHRVAHIATQVCAAMEYTHNLGVIHRDLKPNNIVLIDSPEADTAKVLDFGLARILPGSAEAVQKLTQTGTLIGSVHYMSPEQCTGKTVDRRSDIYSLGCTLYECLSGSPPFDADNPIAILHKHVNEQANTAQLTGVSKEFRSVLLRMLEKNPDNRYQSMADVRADVERALSGVPLAERSAESSPARKPSTSSNAAAALAIFAITCCAFGLFLLSDGGSTLMSDLLISVDASGKNHYLERFVKSLSDAKRVKAASAILIRLADRKPDLILDSNELRKSINSANLSGNLQEVRLKLAAQAARRGEQCFANQFLKSYIEQVLSSQEVPEDETTKRIIKIAFPTAGIKEWGLAITDVLDVTSSFDWQSFLQSGLTSGVLRPNIIIAIIACRAGIDPDQIVSFLQNYEKQLSQANNGEINHLRMYGNATTTLANAASTSVMYSTFKLRLFREILADTKIKSGDWEGAIKELQLARVERAKIGSATASINTYRKCDFAEDFKMNWCLFAKREWSAASLEARDVLLHLDSIDRSDIEASSYFVHVLSHIEVARGMRHEGNERGAATEADKALAEIKEFKSGWWEKLDDRTRRVMKATFEYWLAREYCAQDRREEAREHLVKAINLVAADDPVLHANILYEQIRTNSSASATMAQLAVYNNFRQVAKLNPQNPAIAKLYKSFDSRETKGPEW